MAEAHRAEAAVIAGEELGPLHGVPFGVKDLNATKGIRTTFGSLLFGDNVPKSDDIVTERIRASGAIIVGKTNTPGLRLEGHDREHHRRAVLQSVGHDAHVRRLERRLRGGARGAARAALQRRRRRRLHPHPRQLLRRLRHQARRGTRARRLHRERHVGRALAERPDVHERARLRPAAGHPRRTRPPRPAFARTGEGRLPRGGRSALRRRPAHRVGQRDGRPADRSAGARARAGGRRGIRGAGRERRGRHARRHHRRRHLGIRDVHAHGPLHHARPGHRGRPGRLPAVAAAEVAHRREGVARVALRRGAAYARVAPALVRRVIRAVRRARPADDGRARVPGRAQPEDDRGTGRAPVVGLHAVLPVCQPYGKARRQHPVRLHRRGPARGPHARRAHRRGINPPPRLRRLRGRPPLGIPPPARVPRSAPAPSVLSAPVNSCEGRNLAAPTPRPRRRRRAALPPAPAPPPPTPTRRSRPSCSCCSRLPAAPARSRSCPP